MSHVYHIVTVLIFVVVNFDLACHHRGIPIVPFAFRVHAHSLGEC